MNPSVDRRGPVVPWGAMYGADLTSNCTGRDAVPVTFSTSPYATVGTFYADSCEVPTAAGQTFYGDSYAVNGRYLDDSVSTDRGRIVTANDGDGE